MPVAVSSIVWIKKKNIINGKNNIYFYLKYMSRNAGIVTSEYEPDLGFVISDLGKTWCVAK